MLEIRNVTKIYKTAGLEQRALDDVSLNFRKCEFASILGPSGSGKTTFLNIIGGLDHYTDGDLIINEISTKKYKDSDWDSYRNHRIGFVFQNYNLISHQTILTNVRLALTLSGISKKESIERAKKALKDVGLIDHIHKKPSQLSGGQMQRVAIARALVNDPDILLADEPTGALDSTTSIQIMELLKEIAKNKLVIMVTHNPELAKKYSSRIINLKDGKITKDSNPYDGKDDIEEKKSKQKRKTKKTKMSFFTALSLSFNNLMTKKGRTVLVAFAGSIGIIGIALILAVSTGFQNYIDSIQEETLTSYPLSIMQESTDIAGVLLSMRSNDKKRNGTEVVKEQQYITSTLSNIKSNDLKSFNKYLKDNYNEIKNDVSTIKYSYSIDPPIYTIDSTKKLSKLNPSNLFSSIYSNSIMNSFSTFGSIYSQMIDNYDTLNDQYDVLKGRWPQKYNEMVIVLSDANSISDLLVYSLGLRDNDELTEMVTKIMSGGSVSINNKAKEFTYDDLMNVDLRLINPADIYKYNEKYNIYEDMTGDEKYMNNLYDKATKLKIVGIVTTKEGVTSSSLSPGVAYTSGLIDYMIDYSKDTNIVKNQLSNDLVDVFSNQRFDSKKGNLDFEFSDIISIDNKKLESAFNINIDQKQLQKQTENYMKEINDSITVDTKPAYDKFNKTLDELISGMFDGIETSVSLKDSDKVVDKYLDGYKPSSYFSELEKHYVIPKDMYKTTYSGLLKGLVKAYIASYYMVDQSLTEDPKNPIAVVNKEMLDGVVKKYKESAPVIKASELMASSMTEALVKKNVLTKVGELTQKLTNAFASAFNVDKDKIAEAFTFKLDEEQLSRIISAMTNKKETNAKTNLIMLGYQDKEEPTYISVFFNSFDGKERFLSFIDSYNEKMKKTNQDDKVINYTDTTGILMDSVKTIVNAVSYVLIAFVSISLVVSSIMIGIITYISVYERTKEIGILRSIGASKHNISSIFNAETFIIGLLSGAFGIGISYSLIPIINKVLHKFTGNINLSAALKYNNAILLVVLSIILTLIGGLIPAKAASKKDPVEALRSE